MCRRQTSQVFSVSGCSTDRFLLIEGRGLRWYRSGPGTRRGFCGECGSVLFFEGDEEGRISISAGAFDAPPGFPTGAHIYVRSEEHTSELQSLMHISYAVFCLNTKNRSYTL